MPNIIISDTSCLIILTKINALELLPKIYKTIYTTVEVTLEFGTPLPDWVCVLNISNTSRQKEFEKIVDPGEASTIALACEVAHSF